jgi:hypothetical protein
VPKALRHTHFQTGFSSFDFDDIADFGDIELRKQEVSQQIVLEIAFHGLIRHALPPPCAVKTDGLLNRLFTFRSARCDYFSDQVAEEDGMLLCRSASVGGIIRKGVQPVWKIFYHQDHASCRRRFNEVSPAHRHRFSPERVNLSESRFLKKYDRGA